MRLSALSLSEQHHPTAGFPKRPKLSIVPRSFFQRQRDYIWVGKMAPQTASTTHRLDGMPPCGFDTRQIVLAVLTRHNTTWEALVGPGRFRPLVEARREISRKLHTEKGWAFAQIGRFLNRDHTSIMNLLGNKKRSNPVPKTALDLSK